jgi:hypothetical protein
VRRLRPVLLLLAALVSVATAQTWEKTVAPGLVYRMEVDPTIPRTVHVLRMSPKGDVAAVPELGQGVVYRSDATKGRETISAKVARTGALAAINADFFPFTGKPLGVMVRDQQLLSAGPTQRSVFAWGDEGFFSGFSTFRGAMRVEGGDEVPIDGYNEETGLNRITLNTEQAGLAVAKAPNIAAVIRLDNPEWKPGAVLQGTFAYLYEDVTDMPIRGGNALVVAHGSRTEILKRLRPGQRIEIRLEMNGLDWTKIRHAVGGGPGLVRGGQVFVDWEAQKFQSSFANARHPRTAVGANASGELLFVAVDGRNKMSAGATLDELARLMLRLGSVEAVNLDGGGSTTLNVLGLTVNRPSDNGQERPVANGVAFYGPRPLAGERDLRIDAPAPLVEDGTVQLAVVDADGDLVGHDQVIWAAGARGWIDQGGTLRGLAPGTARVRAFVDGRTLSIEVPVLAKPEPPKVQPPPRGNQTSRGGRRGG